MDLGRNHTVILSSHILPEVSATCERVLIINRGRLVADDTPINLANKLSSGRSHQVQLLVRGDAFGIRRALRELPGVAGLDVDELATGECRVVVDTEEADIREELAHAVVEAGLGLREMQSKTLSLEDIYLSVTMEEEA